MRDHGNAGDIFCYNITLKDSIDNRVGIEILINWEDKRYLICDYFDMKKAILQKVTEKELKDGTSDEIYKNIINPID